MLREDLRVGHKTRTKKINEMEIKCFPTRKNIHECEYWQLRGKYCKELPLKRNTFHSNTECASSLGRLASEKRFSWPNLRSVVSKHYDILHDIHVVRRKLSLALACFMSQNFVSYLSVQTIIKACPAEITAIWSLHPENNVLIDFLALYEQSATLRSANELTR